MFCMKEMGEARSTRWVNLRAEQTQADLAARVEIRVEVRNATTSSPELHLRRHLRIVDGRAQVEFEHACSHRISI